MDNNNNLPRRQIFQEISNKLVTLNGRSLVSQIKVHILEPWNVKKGFNQYLTSLLNRQKKVL